MTRKEAAQTLTKLLAKYEELDKSWGGINDKYYEAVTIACGVLLVDDVLNTNPIPPKGEDNMTDYISREAAKEKCCSLCRWEGTSNCDECEHPIDDIPAADVPSALWTDEPISGTEFMTHNQGQSGFEIHFRTDDKAKYEAVQEECRRQIGHAKPAADVRPVVRGKWIWKESGEVVCSKCNDLMAIVGNTEDFITVKYYHNFCPNCGADMREEN